MSQPDKMSVELDGLQVELFRGRDGKLVVSIESSFVDDKDQYPNGVPNIRIWINEQKIEINDQGDLVEE